MLIYILKFSACLAVLLIFYKLFLERESIHVFKRFYLLTALVFSLVVPTLVFTEYVPARPNTDIAAQSTSYSNEVINVPPALESDISDIAPLLWGLYFLGLIFFGIKFVKNLFQIFRRIQNNPKQQAVSFVRVLLHENFPPHTFFKYIFLNKIKLESNKIPEEVLLHEEIHAKQRHSLDVLFIELLQIIIWFNPLIYFMRKSIKLNHEFLADKAVLKKGIDPLTYQNTLLSFMTPMHHQSLANAINYSSIKKRFTVMKTKTSKKSVLLRSFLLLPLLAVLLLSFSTKVKIENETIPEILEILQEGATSEMVAEYNALAQKYNAMSKNNFRILLSEVDRMKYIYNAMSTTQKKNAEPFPDLPDPPPVPSPPSPPQMASTEVAVSPVVAPKMATKVSAVVTPEVTTKVHAAVTTEVATEATVVPEVVEVPPPPPPPKSPVEFAEEMAKKNAEFYYNGKKISAAKAIEILENSEHISLVARHTNLKRPRVELSDGPINVVED